MDSLPAVSILKYKKYRLPAGPSLYRSLKGTRKFIKDPIKAVSKTMELYSGTFSSALGFSNRGIVTQNPAFINHVLKENHKGYGKSRLATEMSSKFMGNGILFTNGEYWLRQRRMIQPAFHREKLQGLNELIKTVINDSLTRFPVGSGVDVCPFLHTMSFNVLIRSLFNIPLPPETVDEIMELFTQIQEFLMRDATGIGKLLYFVTRADKITMQRSLRLRGIIRGIIRQRRSGRDESPDLLQMLMSSTYEDSGEHMPEDQIIDEVMILIFAGHETVANTLSWLLYLLASNQDTLQQLTGSLAGIPAAGVLTNEYLKATIYEGMRLYPAAWMTERVALEDDRVGEYSFPRGTIIISFLFGLHRDERLWKDASIFKPQRFIDDPGAARSGNFYPFGAGPRMCVGNNFAMVEMSLFLAAFFKQFQLRPTGQVPEMIARITLKPDRVILNSTKNA